MAILWQINPRWSETLAAAGLDTFAAAFAYTTPEPLSRKSHSLTHSAPLPDGGTAFVKQDLWTGWRPVARALLRLSRPLPAVGRERRNMLRLSKLGFHTPEIAAYGECRRFALPHQGVMITAPAPGRPVDRIFRDTTLSAALREEAVAAALAILAQLQQHGCNWGKDCKPEHFFYSVEKQITLIDVERMHFQRRPLPTELCRKQLERFRSLL